MDLKGKLFIVIEHWIEHNESHAEEYERWAQTAGELGFNQVKEEIGVAMEKISQANQHLKKALSFMST